VVDLVLGETPDFERAEIERVLVGSPELQLFRKGIESVHGLLGAGAEPLPWRLADDRRAKVLATISAPPPPSRSRWWTHPVFRIAAVFVVAAAVSLPFLLSPPRPRPRLFAVAEVERFSEPSFRDSRMNFELAPAARPKAALPAPGSAGLASREKETLASRPAPGPAADRLIPEEQKQDKILAFSSRLFALSEGAIAPLPMLSDAGLGPIFLPLQVGDASFWQTHTALTRKRRPEPETIRTEEFVNAFPSGAPRPDPTHPATFTSDQALHPVLPHLRLLRLGIGTLPGSGTPHAIISLNPNRVRRYHLFGFDPAPPPGETPAPAPSMDSPSNTSILLELEILPSGSGELGSVMITFEGPSTPRATGWDWVVPCEPDPAPLSSAAPHLRAAALAAWTAEKLRQQQSTAPDQAFLSLLHAGLQDGPGASEPVKALGTMLRTAEGR
jgi:hypothetical protein